MPDLPAFVDLQRTGRAEILVRSARLSADVVDREGTDANAFVAMGAAISDQVVGEVARYMAGGFLDSATGDLLDRVVYDRYGLLRTPASVALGQVEFSTTAAAVAAFTIPANTKVQTADGVQYLTIAAVTYPHGSVGPITANVRSVLAGLSQQAKSGTITSVISPITGQPADLHVTNSMATAGASDEEDDNTYRERARKFFSTARRGTLKAIEQGALAVAGIRRATAFDRLDVDGSPARQVLLVVADAFTEALVDQTTVPAAYEAQSNVLSVTVFNALADVRAGGIKVQVQVASVVLQPVSIVCAYKAGVDTEAVGNAARAAVVEHINSRAPGQTLSIQALRDKLDGVTGLVAAGTDVLVPNGDVVPLPLQVLRAALTQVSIV